MKKVKLFQSSSIVEAIKNLDRINFNINAGVDFNTNIKAPALLYIFEMIGSHGALVSLHTVSSSIYNIVIYSKATGSIGLDSSVSLLKIYVDANNYIHIQNLSTRTASGTVRILNA